MQVNGRVISKQIHVRVEHVSPSKCRDELKRRVKDNEAAKKAAREGGGECLLYKVVDTTTWKNEFQLVSIEVSSRSRTILVIRHFTRRGQRVLRSNPRPD